MRWLWLLVCIWECYSITELVAVDPSSLQQLRHLEPPHPRLATATALPGTLGSTTSGFGFDLAGVLVLADDPLQGTFAQLSASHFGYAGNYAMNGCRNNNQPFSCKANQCNYPGSTPVDAEIGDYATLAKWLAEVRAAGLYAGIWTAVYGLNGEAEASCIAEVLASLRGDHNSTVDFFASRRREGI